MCYKMEGTSLVCEVTVACNKTTVPSKELTTQHL